MLEMIKGCRIHDPSLLDEGYQSTETGYAANVNAGKIGGLIEDFIHLQTDRVFLILEVPTNQKDEEEIAPGIVAALHMDVYYLDGLRQEDAIQLLRDFGELFIQDGMIRFGFGSHGGNNEILLDFYNVVTIYTKTPEQYAGMFERHGISRVPELKTAWDLFTHSTPGECSKITVDGRDIYEIVEHLKQYGLYFAERREKI